MDTREYLRQIQWYDRRVQNKLVEEYQLRSLATSISISYSEHVQTSKKQDALGDTVSKIVDLQQEISECVNEYIVKRKEIIQTIESVNPSKLYTILFKHYVEYKTFAEIAEETKYSEVDVRRSHLKALEEVRKIKNFES